MADDLFERMDLSTAEQLLDELTPHRGEKLWERDRNQDWIFRGQEEAIWSLKPSAQRTKQGTTDVYDAFLPLLFKITRGSPGRRLEPTGEPVVDARLLVALELIVASASDVARRERPT